MNKVAIITKNNDLGCEEPQNQTNVLVSNLL